MIIIKDIKTIFIHVQRTGGSSIIQLLHDYFQYRMKSTTQHGNYQSEDAQLVNKYPNYFLFGYVRNPWDRILSWYSLIHRDSPLPFKQEKKRFEEFLVKFETSIKNDNTFHFNQLDYFPNHNEISNEVHILRYENFQSDADKVFRRFDIKIPKIKRSNNTKPKNYRDYYTDIGKKIITENCARDIEYFHYSY